MGSWNETCWLSNLPILEGEKIYLVLLKENLPYGSSRPTRTRSFVHNHALWAPFALPISGLYEGYGRLEDWDSTDLALETLRVFLRNNVVTYPLGENEYHHKPVTREMFDSTDWVEQIQQRMSHGKGIQVSDGGKHRLGAVFIRGDVYDALSERSFISWNGEEIDVSSRMRTIASYAENLVELEIHEKAFFTDVGDKAKGSSYFGARRRADETRPVDNSWYAHWVLNKQFSLGDEVVQRMAAFLHVADAAEGLRKLWHPTCGAGSSSEEWDLYMDFAKIVYACAKKSQIRSSGEDEEEEEDDEDLDEKV